MSFQIRLLKKDRRLTNELSADQSASQETTRGQATPLPMGSGVMGLFGLIALGLVASSAQANSTSTRVLGSGSISCEEQPGARYSVKLPTAKQVSPKVSFVVSLAPTDAKPGATVTLTVKTVIQPGWHVSALGGEQGDSPSLPTSIEFDGRGLTPIDKLFSPSVEPSLVKIGKSTHLQHTGTFHWQRKYRVDSEAQSYSGSGSIRFQVCDEEKCLPPNDLSFSLGAEAQALPELSNLARASRKAVGEPIIITLAAASLERKLINTSELVTADPQVDMDAYIEQMLASMNATEALTLGGSFEMGGESVALYLADQEEYSLVNTGHGETNFQNTSTYISIDYNGDGEIVDYESLASNLPIRLFDSMFLVTEINKGKQTITLQQIDIPLAGAVMNRRCPDFRYETVDGQIVSNESILGTTTILDVWAVT